MDSFAVIAMFNVAELALVFAILLLVLQEKK